LLLCVSIGSIKEGKWPNGHGSSLPKSRKHCWGGNYWIFGFFLNLTSYIFGDVVIETEIEFYHCYIHFQVVIEPVQGKKVEHNGVKIELLGQIGVLNSLPFLIFRSCILYLGDHVHIVIIIIYSIMWKILTWTR
jgi:hypothetical protein